MEIITFLDTPSFTEKVTLDGTSYVLAFKWNSRYEFWTMSFLDNLRNELISGIKLVKSYELIRQYSGRGLPPGELYAFDVAGQESKRNRIQYQDFFNDIVRLTYFSEDEVLT
jgi:hypothetical protein